MSSISGIEEFRKVRLEKLEKAKELGAKPYQDNFNPTHQAKKLIEKYADLEDGQVTEDTVFVAGRIMSLRNDGMFIDLNDNSDKIQIFSHKNNITPEMIELVKTFDIGDIIGVEGIIRRTPRGELTINSKTLTLLTKALLPLPEKYHGLHDVETRYRQRYLDLIINEKSKETLQARSKIISYMRSYLVENNFLEVETPMLHVTPGGATAKPFATYHNALDSELFLRIAPELYLKKLIVGGLSDKIFELNRCFRNEGISPRHNPEFTSVEIYQAYADHKDMMSLTENIVNFAVQKLYNNDKVIYNEQELNFTTPWPKKSMANLVKEHTNIDFNEIKTDAEARDAAKSLNIEVDENWGWGKAMEAVFAEKVEEHLMQPIHVTEFPKEISPLAKANSENPLITDRFESYANGWEIANGFAELNDPIDQYNRFAAQMKERELGDEEAQILDEDFVTALEHGMPPTGGLGIGIDRLVMLLTDSKSIREVIAFPTLKPKNK